MQLMHKWCYVCVAYLAPFITHAAAFCISWSFWIFFRDSPMQSMFAVPKWEVTRAWVTMNRASRSKNECNWHTMWRYTKSLLTMATNCRSHESRGALDCAQGLTPSAIKDGKSLSPQGPRTHSNSALLGLSWSLFRPVPQICHCYRKMGYLIYFLFSGEGICL